MKKVVVSVLVLASTLTVASDTVTLSETGFSAERKIVARIYSKEIDEAKSIPSLSGDPVVAISTIDLNRDGKQEIIARIMHTYWCGSHGCKLVILTMLPDGTWKEIASLVSHGELEVHDEYKNNYRTITFDHSNKTWVFENGKYQ